MFLQKKQKNRKRRKKKLPRLMRWKPLPAPHDQQPSVSAPPPRRLSVCSCLTERESWMAARERERDRRQERWGRRCERSRRLTLTLSCLCSLHGREVSPAPSLPRMLMQPPLPGNRLLGVAQGLGTRNICDRGHDEGPKGLL